MTQQSMSKKSIAQRYCGGYNTAKVDECRLGRTYVNWKVTEILHGRYEGNAHWLLGYVDGSELRTPKYTTLDCVG